MFTEALYIILITFEIILLGGICVYVLLLIYSWLKGAPYVPTQQKEIEGILEEAALIKGMHFLELGCGDGRVVRLAAEKFEVNGVGVDVNPELIIRANILAKSKHLDNVTFQVKNILETDLSKADVIYIYLFPKLIERIKDKLIQETKDDVFIISHGFKIPFLSSMLVKERKGTKYNTYYYQKAQNVIDKSL